MSEEVTGSGKLLSRVQELENKLKDSERKRIDLIQSNADLQKILKTCRKQEVRAQQEIASLLERLVSLKAKKVEGLGHKTTIKSGYQHWTQQLRSSTDGGETEGAYVGALNLGACTVLLIRDCHRHTTLHAISTVLSGAYTYDSGA